MITRTSSEFPHVRNKGGHLGVVRPTQSFPTSGNFDLGGIFRAGAKLRLGLAEPGGTGANQHTSNVTDSDVASGADRMDRMRARKLAGIPEDKYRDWRDVSPGEWPRPW